MQHDAIGYLGGTFDPVHYGHLRSAIECAQAFDLAQVHLMPCKPVHKDEPLIESFHRQAMLNLAVQESTHLLVNDYELKQPNSTYTIDTLRYLRQEIGYEKPLYFILGVDAFNAIESWKEWQMLFDQVNFIVIQRPGVELQLNHPILKDKLTRFEGVHCAFGCIYSFTVTALDISSTKIRQLIKQQQSIEFLLPKSVEHYLQQQGLYQ